MKDIRMKELPFEFDGKVYKLRCNMNVLADVQDEFNGDFSAVLEAGMLKSVLSFLAAMLNDYADEQGWPERFTARQIGRKLKMSDIPSADIMQLVTGALVTDETEKEAEKN